MEFTVFGEEPMAAK